MLFSIKPSIIWKKQKKAKKRHFERANFGSSNNMWNFQTLLALTQKIHFWYSLNFTLLQVNHNCQVLYDICLPVLGYYQSWKLYFSYWKIHFQSRRILNLTWLMFFCCTHFQSRNIVAYFVNSMFWILL